MPNLTYCLYPRLKCDVYTWRNLWHHITVFQPTDTKWYSASGCQGDQSDQERTKRVTISTTNMTDLHRTSSTQPKVKSNILSLDFSLKCGMAGAFNIYMFCTMTSILNASN